MDLRGSLLALTPDVVVERLLERMGNNPERYGIQWTHDFGDYYIAKVDNVNIKCFVSASSLAGIYVNKICLIISHDGKDRIIKQPNIHISQVPLGKFLRFATRLSRGLTILLGIGPYPKELHPSEPQTQKEREDERLRIGLDKLYSRIEIQLEYRENKERGFYS